MGMGYYVPDTRETIVLLSEILSAQAVDVVVLVSTKVVNTVEDRVRTIKSNLKHITKHSLQLATLFALFTLVFLALQTRTENGLINFNRFIDGLLNDAHQFFFQLALTFLALHFLGKNRRIR